MATTNERLTVLETLFEDFQSVIDGMPVAYVPNLTFKRLDTQRTAERDQYIEALQAEIDSLKARVLDLENQ